MQQRSFFLPITTFFLLIVCLLTLFGCKLPTSPNEAPVNEEFTISIGQEVTIKGEPLKIFFKSVPEDSRCPERATCIWEGNAKAAFELRTTAQPYPILLNTHKSFPYRERFMEYELELLQLNPKPVTGKTIEQREYTARVILRKK